VKAIEALTAALKIDPNLASALSARGFAPLKANQYRGAIADLDEAIRLDPTYGYAYARRAAARRATRDQSGADADQDTVRFDHGRRQCGCRVSGRFSKRGRR